MATAFKRGRPIFYDHVKKEWYWAEDGLPITVEKPCIRCGSLPNLKGMDACLGRIDGVWSACCGHGVSEGIMKYEEGERL